LLYFKHVHTHLEQGACTDRYIYAFSSYPTFSAAAAAAAVVVVVVVVVVVRVGKNHDLKKN